MDERQQAMTVASGRALASLRDLTRDEAITVLNRLGQVAPTGDRSASLWASRGESTWIDRL